MKTLLRPEDLYINLLPRKNFLRYAKSITLFRAECDSHLKNNPGATIIVDEIQKAPQLLDEVHDLIEETNTRFILTGSSARKLKRGTANLLAGRAYTNYLYPLTWDELSEHFEIEEALRFGTLPPLWNDDGEDARQFLRAYVDTYLREEIQEEGRLQSIGPFSVFLDIAAANDGQLVNYTTIARECGVTAKTVKAYYQILVDSFLAYELHPWHTSLRKRLVTHPRYYFFDTGVTNALTHQLEAELDTVTRGRRFEQFVINQLRAAFAYRGLDRQFWFWRTNHGAEVDLLVSTGAKLLFAVEIKSNDASLSTNLSGIRSIREEYPELPCYIVGVDHPTIHLENGITLTNFKDFIVRASRG